MGVWSGMRFGAIGGEIEKCAKTAFWIYVVVGSAVRTQLTKQEMVSCVDTLADDGDSNARYRRLFGRNGSVQAVAIISGGLAKCVLFMRCPKVRRQVFDQLRGLIHPVEFF